MKDIVVFLIYALVLLVCAFFAALIGIGEIIYLVKSKKISK
jgi:hypothetical protein